MNLIRKGHGHTHRGVIGVESAIVMIAFVIVAAALAFVVLNMGFSTTQKAKTTIISGLSEASSSLEVAGKVMGIACTTAAKGCSTPYLNATGIPLRIASGGDAVNLEESYTQVKYLSNSIEYDDIYIGAVTTATASSLEGGFDAGITAFSELGTADNPVDQALTSGTYAFTYWSVSRGTQNAILDEGEHAILAIGFDSNATPEERPTALDKMRVEVILATGASLTVERDIPTLTHLVTDLG
ncbi:MAG: flagellin [Crenarchaeota archaeon]|nr:MAG: flagellin [Thermoproteota archaeon]RDJ34540.1 MAG: flagellin [Thermoproteota archaeon]RDJ35940.1 MAG: flagellin [Thermoproteota archaeon]RDJ38517.1 MAG: flagellin [Thermoproteota archaeon]